MKSGGSMFVPVPPMVIDAWGLEKGTEVHVEVTQDEMRIRPIARIAAHEVRDEDLERFWEAMRQVDVKVWLEDDGSSLRVQFSSPDPEVAKGLARNLQEVLPAMLGMLGIRSGEATSE